MARELAKLRGEMDAATATAELLAETRRPLTGVAAVLNVAIALLDTWTLGDALAATYAPPSAFDLFRSGWWYRDPDIDDLRKALTLQFDGAQAIEVAGGGLRQRLPFDLTVGSTHVVRVIVGTVPTRGPVDLGLGMERVWIRHPKDADRFVLLERVADATGNPAEPAQ